MPFTLCTISANFQRYINKVLAEQLYVFVIIYPNNILIYNNNTDHVDTVWLVSNPLKKYFLYVNLKKSGFYQDEMQFLGYIMSLRGIFIENKKIKAICASFESQ